MSTDCDPDILESLVLGELTVTQAAAVVAHASGCHDCTRELALLRAERAAFVERADRLATPPLVAAAPPASVAIAVATAVRPGLARRPASRAWWVAPAAVAAALALGIAGSIAMRREPGPAVTGTVIAPDPSSSPGMVCEASEASEADDAAPPARLRTSFFACAPALDLASEGQPSCAASCGPSRSDAEPSVTPAP